MKKARIVLDRFEPCIRSWNWRDDWYTKYDSTYSLFAKFAFLNAFAARDLVQIFISCESGRRTAVLRNPQVDLRDSMYFDIPAISRAFRTDLNSIKESFLFEMLPNGKRKSVDYLRWCTKCAAIGFHSPLFQLEIITDCPIHSRPLRSNCPHCSAKVPYKLRRDVIDIPFTCTVCKTDFAPVLRNPQTRSLQLRVDEMTRLDNIIDLLKFEDRLIPLKLEINRERKFQGMGEVIIAPADLRRRHAEYIGFVIQVLDDLKAESDTAQPPLELTQISHIYLGTRPEPLQRAKVKKYRRTKVSNDDKLITPVKQSWDDMLYALYTLYSAIRRKIWRSMITAHQSCVTSAAHQLWWHLEGEKTVNFCPIAEAFLRWRMFWEGCGSPQHLVGPLTKPPFGILGWQAEAAPICPPGWSRETEIWVAKHVFSRACMSNFYDWVEVASHSHANGNIVWSKHATSGRFESYWALTGHDSWQRPVRIYMQSEVLQTRVSLRERVDCEHYLDHKHQISQLKR
nr:hypothetical protein [Janthinobacterium sp. Marseille]